MNIPYAEIFKCFNASDFFHSESLQKTYQDFQEDIQNQAIIFQTQHKDDFKVVVKNSNQYLFLVEVFALWAINKVPVLISPKATAQSEQVLLDQILLTENVANAETSNEALILFTSGSTDLPKGVSLTFLNLEFQAKTFANFFKSKPGEAYFLNLPLNHASGLMLCLRAFHTGGKISTLATRPYSYISLVPHQLDNWLVASNLLAGLQKAKAILIGGASLSADLKNRASAASLPLYETYGMTETTTFITLNGELLPDREIRVNDEGIISIKGPMLASGHYIHKTFIKIPEWFVTNDLGIISPHNVFSFKGRKGSLLISGGENISSYEIENTVLSLSGIKEAHVVGIPDEKWGDLVALLYESLDDKNNEIKKRFSECLHPYHIPKFILRTTFSNTSEFKISKQTIKFQAYELFLKEIFSYSYLLRSKEKPTVVIFHGFMENKEDWDFLSVELGNAYNVLSIDLPGHGKTDLTNFFSLQEILTRLRDFIFLFSNTPILIGYSMGGRIALNLSEHYLKPQKLFLISSSLGLETESEQEERYKADLKLFDKINVTYSLEQFFIDWYRHPIFHPYIQSENFDKDIQKKSKMNHKNWEASLKFFSQGKFPLSKKTPFTYPVFYLSGSEDKKYSATSIASHHTIPGAGHNLHKTHPQELIKVLSNLL